MPTFKIIEACSVCSRVIVESLSEKPEEYTAQRCCGQRAIIRQEQVDDSTELAGFKRLQRVEADIYRGGVQDDDGITTGSKLVTKRGFIESVSVVGPYKHVFIRFDDGDVQNCGMGALDGKEPGYPCAAFRRVTKL